MMLSVSVMENIYITKSGYGLIYPIILNVVFNPPIMEVMAQAKNIENIYTHNLKEQEWISKIIVTYEILEENMEMPMVSSLMHTLACEE